MEHAMMDMGREEKRGIPEEKEESRIVYPSFTIVGDKISEELKNAKLETMHRCEVYIKKVGDDVDTYATNRPRRVQVEIHKMGHIAHTGKKTFEEYQKSSKEEKEEYDRHETRADEKEEE